MNADEHAARIAHIRAERAAMGRPPLIQSPKVYRLLSAVVDGQRERDAVTTSTATAVMSTSHTEDC